MCIFRRDGKADRLILIGFVFLALANAAQLILRRAPSLGDGPTDAFVGLLFGIAIGSLALGIWRSGRGGSNPRPRTSV
jgi:hypothetical protein